MADTNIAEAQRCTRCDTAKPLTDFTFQKNRPLGRHSHCKVCCRDTARKYREIDRTKALQDAPWRRWQHVSKADYMRAHENRWNIPRKYGISLHEYCEMVERQKGLCGLCKRIPRDGKNLCIDHCHDSGKIRGLLCTDCNLGLGQLGDTVEALERALDYLKAA